MHLRATGAVLVCFVHSAVAPTMSDVMTSLRSLPAVPVQPPTLPLRLQGLLRLAYNLYWTWNPRVVSLFKRIDAHTWSLARHPVAVLHAQNDWSSLLDNHEFMAQYDTVLAQFDKYIDAPHSSTSFGAAPRPTPAPIAYFCAEFGLHEHLPIYSGGLGVLAGDHVKTASDMGLPLVAVGLLYRQGYFRQSIDAEGLQEHAYPHIEPERMPLMRALHPRTGKPLMVGVEVPQRTIHAAVWVAWVGRVPLLLLDTDVPDNHIADRPTTAQLYVRGRDMRLHQELLLGVGGVRALRALGIAPAAWHLNEGHSALMLVERLREQVVAGLSFDAACVEVKRSSVFTIHTPVSAGNEKFDCAAVTQLTEPMLRSAGIDVQQVLALGRGEGANPHAFDMTAFSLRMSVSSNAVSQLHAHTANQTWQAIFGAPPRIKAVTNGIHVSSWLGQRMRWLCEDRGVSLETLDREERAGDLRRLVDSIEDDKLWDGHQRQKLEMFFFARGRLRKQLARHGESPDTLRGVDNMFDANALTLGFARRFATYKRAHLLFTDEDRLARLLWNKDRPVQVVFAGKAHPADRPGQAVIRDLWQKSRSDKFRGRIFVLEDYDMRIGRFLVEGVDLWLNNPRRPLEASGTSGMKAAVNGVPSVSVLDGWWDEGFDGHNGWAIGTREQNPNEHEQDHADAHALYDVLEQHIVPTYFVRDARGIPVAWVERMRAALRSSLYAFSTHRMLEQYASDVYACAQHKEESQ
jgi:glycogen phosphorylase